jgi:hypothetical protein
VDAKFVMQILDKGEVLLAQFTENTSTIKIKGKPNVFIVLKKVILVNNL